MCVYVYELSSGASLRVWSWDERSTRVLPSVVLVATSSLVGVIPPAALIEPAIDPFARIRRFDSVTASLPWSEAVARMPQTRYTAGSEISSLLALGFSGL